MTSDRAYYDGLWSRAPLELNSDQILRLGKILCAYAEIAYTYRDKKPSICDFGCGTGWLTHELSKVGDVLGIDRSQKGIERATSRYHEAKFLCADVLSFTTDARFDVIVSSEVLEHVEDQATYVATAHELLNPGGYLILTCPNGNAWSIASTQGELQPTEIWPTPRQLRSLLAPGFEILTHETFLTGYAQTGVLRWANSRKLLAWAKILRAEHLLRGFFGQLEKGLYQLALARKKS